MKTIRFKSCELGPIPEDWEVKCLGDVGAFKNGISKGADAFGHGVPFVNLLDVFGKSRLTSTKGLGLVEATHSEIIDCGLEDGDTLFVRSSVKPEGVGLATVIEGNLPNTVFSGFLLRYRERSMISGFKRYAFAATWFRQQVIASSTVSANTNVNQTALKRLIVAVPPRPEQERIAEALSDVDALLSAMTTLIEKKRAIKQGAMQQLLTGKKRLAGFTGPWVEKRLGDVCELNPPGGGIPDRFVYIDLESVVDGALIGRKIVEKCCAPSRAQRRFKRGDILFQTVRPYQKNNLFVDFEAARYVASTGYAVLRGLPGIGCSAFVYYVLHTDGFTGEVLDRCTGTSYPAINPGKLAEITLRLPQEVVEQQAIAAVLSDMDAEIAALESKRAKYESIKQGMMQELLTGKTRLV